MTNKNIDFRSTPVWQGVESVILSGTKNTKYDLLIKVHTPEGDFNILKLKEYQEFNDYVKDTAGDIHITFMLGLGDYTYKLYPFRSLIEVTVKKVFQDEASNVDIEEESPTIRYRAILDLKKNPKVTGDRVTQMGYETLNQSSVVEVTLNLIDRNQELLRVAMTPGNIYPEATPEQIISGILTGESNKWIVDGKGAIEGFNIVKPDNSASISGAYIPAIKLPLVPTYVQEVLTGVYSSGLGTHYQRFNNTPSWFVYPLFNTERFDSEDVDRVVFYSVPEDQLSGIDRTYRKEGNILYIAITGQRNYQDDSQMSDLNEGVGFRLPNASGIFNGGADMTPSGPVADRARLNTEVGSRKRDDGVYYAPTISPSDNPFKHYSRLAAQQTSQLNVVWENSYPDYIYPGMPCKYVFMDQDEYRELKGTILGKYTSVALIGAPVTSSTYRQSTTLGIALEYYEDTPLEQPISNSPGVF